MPRTAKSPYGAYKNFELSLILNRRGLPYSGTKSEMCARLDANDVAHPFPFLKLPPEIRNTIYKLVAALPLTSEDPRVRSVLKKREELWVSEKLHGSPELMIVQPGLFAVSKQIRAEGLGLYYQYHRFACYLIDPTYFSRALTPLLKWLDHIGEVGRANIRYLRFRADRANSRARVMSRLHRELSDKATVIWEADPEKYTDRDLWFVGRSYRQRNPNKLPVFETNGHQRFSTFDSAPSGNLRGSTLTFYPGMGWFGTEDGLDESESDEDVQI